MVDNPKKPKSQKSTKPSGKGTVAKRSELESKEMKDQQDSVSELLPTYQEVVSHPKKYQSDRAPKGPDHPQRPGPKGWSLTSAAPKIAARPNSLTSMKAELDKLFAELPRLQKEIRERGTQAIQLTTEELDFWKGSILALAKKDMNINNDLVSPGAYKKYTEEVAKIKKWIEDTNKFIKTNAAQITSPKKELDEQQSLNTRIMNFRKQQSERLKRFNQLQKDRKALIKGLYKSKEEEKRASEKHLGLLGYQRVSHLMNEMQKLELEMTERRKADWMQRTSDATRGASEDRTFRDRYFREMGRLSKQLDQELTQLDFALQNESAEKIKDQAAQFYEHLSEPQRIRWVDGVMRDHVLAVDIKYGHVLRHGAQVPRSATGVLRDLNDTKRRLHKLERDDVIFRALVHRNIEIDFAVALHEIESFRQTVTKLVNELQPGAAKDKIKTLLDQAPSSKALMDARDRFAQIPPTELTTKLTLDDVVSANRQIAQSKKELEAWKKTISEDKTLHEAVELETSRTDALRDWEIIKAHIELRKNDKTFAKQYDELMNTINTNIYALNKVHLKDLDIAYDILAMSTHGMNTFREKIEPPSIFRRGHHEKLEFPEGYTANAASEVKGRSESKVSAEEQQKTLASYGLRPWTEHVKSEIFKELRDLLMRVPAISQNVIESKIITSINSLKRSMADNDGLGAQLAIEEIKKNVEELLQDKKTNKTIKDSYGALSLALDTQIPEIIALTVDKEEPPRPNGSQKASRKSRF